MITSQRRSNSQIEELISNWLESFSAQNTPEKTLEVFKYLFVDGLGNSDTVISEVIEDLVLNKDKNAERDFLKIIDRSCYQIITSWLVSEQFEFVCKLVTLVSKTTTGKEQSYSKLPHRLNNLWKQYIQNGYFLHLRKLQIIITKRSADSSASHVVANLLDRYPFLYMENLLTDNALPQYLATIQRIQQQAQKDYELRFSQYLTYQIRKAILKQNPESQKVITPVPNPTLLKSRELGTILQSYVGGMNGENYWDNACHFQVSIQHPIIFIEFKKALYQYLILDLANTTVPEQKIQSRLKKQLKNILVESNNKPIDEMLKVHTYTQLLNFLIIESADRPNHVVLIDLIANLGAAATVGLLLKIILICPQAQAPLERLLSALFNHYYNSNYDQLPWLIQFLENWHVASSIYFGKLDSSVLKQILGNVIGDTSRI